MSTYVTDLVVVKYFRGVHKIYNYNQHTFVHTVSQHNYVVTLRIQARRPFLWHPIMNYGRCLTNFCLVSDKLSLFTVIVCACIQCSLVLIYTWAIHQQLHGSHKHSKLFTHHIFLACIVSFLIINLRTCMQNRFNKKSCGYPRPWKYFYSLHPKMQLKGPA